MEFRTMLNEICKTSATKAAIALSKFLQTPLDLDMKPLEVGRVDDINDFNDSTKNTVNIFMPIIGSLSGASFFLYSEQSALALCDVLFKRSEGSTLTFAEPEISALDEVANIVMGNFLSIFAQSLHLDFLMHRSAIFDCGPFNTTFNEKIHSVTDKKDQALLRISFGFKHINIQGYVLIIFDEGEVNNILNNITFTSDT